MTSKKKYPETISLMGGPFDGAWVTEGFPEYAAQTIEIPLKNGTGFAEVASIVGTEDFVLHRYVKKFSGEVPGIHRVVFVWEGKVGDDR